MRLEYQIIIAFLVDFLLGDPRWMPHPVRAIGWLAVSLESPLRRLIPWPRVAGAVTVVVVVGLSTSLTWALVRACVAQSPMLGAAVSVVLIYSTIALRDLAKHARQVHAALETSQLETARQRVGMIVGRDTDALDEAGITRATVESVAESIVDGITAPLFFAAVAGPAGAVAYRAVNTLDSTFGYLNSQHRHFGWASAKLDDAANYIPARLTAPIISLAAFMLRLRAVDSIRTVVRDRRNHSSPNAGYAESAVAGALGVRLGGLNYYFGKPIRKPTIGDPDNESQHIMRALQLASVASILFLGLVTGCRAVALFFIPTGGPTL